MQERARSCGGSLTARPAPDGGFEVRAAIPSKGKPHVTIRVVLADDQALLRATFRLLLDSEPDMEVVAEAGTEAEAEAVTRARDSQADLVLMDIRMPDMDGIEATSRITGDAALAGVKVLVLTTYETDDLVVGAQENSGCPRGTARAQRGPRLTAPPRVAGICPPRTLRMAATSPERNPACGHPDPYHP
jgi:CheY-like chemotaxis protein